MEIVNLNNIFIHPIDISNGLANSKLSILRTDLIHPVVSGNKWFKLQYYIQEAIEKKAAGICTFGGAYSNHIVATAYACKSVNMPCVGFIRGEASKTLSHTLKDAQRYDMQLIFTPRSEFKNKENLFEKHNNQYKNWLWINEGGYGLSGALGASTIGKFIPENATHLICAIGTGTMMAGLIKTALPHQTVIGISSMKNEGLKDDIMKLLSPEEQQKRFIIWNDYHFGGYAKCNQQLIDWMNTLYSTYQLPTDRIYTAKMMFGLFDRLKTGFFETDSNIVAIHSGGLQGNLSLPPHSLSF